MKRIAHSVFVAGLALALGACSNTATRGDTARASDTINGEYGSTADVSSSPGSAATGSSHAGATGSAASGQAAHGAHAGSVASTPNSTVTNIEVIPRQSGATATGAGTVAGAAVGGSTASGASMSSDRVYRITVRMDDGAVRTITQESTPAFSTGDRVHLSNDAIVR